MAGPLALNTDPYLMRMERSLGAACQAISVPHHVFNIISLLEWTLLSGMWLLMSVLLPEMQTRARKESRHSTCMTHFREKNQGTFLWLSCLPLSFTPWVLYTVISGQVSLLLLYSICPLFKTLS